MGRSKKALTRHLIGNVILLLAAVCTILIFSSRENYARQIQQIDDDGKQHWMETKIFLWKTPQERFTAYP